MSINTAETSILNIVRTGKNKKKQSRLERNNDANGKAAACLETDSPCGLALTTAGRGSSQRSKGVGYQPGFFFLCEKRIHLPLRCRLDPQRASACKYSRLCTAASPSGRRACKCAVSIPHCKQRQLHNDSLQLHVQATSHNISNFHFSAIDFVLERSRPRETKTVMGRDWNIIAGMYTVWIFFKWMAALFDTVCEDKGDSQFDINYINRRSELRGFS